MFIMYKRVAVPKLVAPLVHTRTGTLFKKRFVVQRVPNVLTSVQFGYK